MYIPSTFVVVAIPGDDPHYKVLAGWSGSYFNAASWRMSSGITKAEFKDGCWYFYNTSGSCYKCWANNYRLNLSTSYVWATLKEKFGDKVRILDKEEWDTEKWDWILK